MPFLHKSVFAFNNCPRPNNIEAPISWNFSTKVPRSLSKKSTSQHSGWVYSLGTLMFALQNGPLIRVIELSSISVLRFTSSPEHSFKSLYHFYRHLLPRSAFTIEQARLMACNTFFNFRKGTPSNIYITVISAFSHEYCIFTSEEGDFRDNAYVDVGLGSQR